MLVAYGMLLVLQPFAGAMAWAIFLAFLLHPLHRWLTRKLRDKPSVSAGLITGLTPFALLTPLTLLAFSSWTRLARWCTSFSGSDFKLDGSILMRLEQYPVIGPLARMAREELSVSAADIQDWLGRATEAALRSVASDRQAAWCSAALGTLVAFFFMLFLLFFFLRDGTQHVRPAAAADPGAGRTSRAALRSPRERHARRVLRHRPDGDRPGHPGRHRHSRSRACRRRWCSACSPASSRCCPRAARPSCGFRRCCTWRPRVTGEWSIFMLIWGVIISTSDNFLRPILVSRYAPVSAFTVFVGVVGGIGAFGAIGIVVGPVFLALVAAILEYFDEKVIAPNKRSLDAQADDERPPPMPGL